MKRSIFIILLTLICTTGFAQLSFNAKAGLNMSTYIGKNSEDSKIKAGARLGVGLEYEFNDIISLQPSLFFSQKGSAYSKNIDFGKNTHSKTDLIINQLYLEIPINAQFRFEVSDNVNIVFATGPYLAVGVGGKTRFETESDLKILSVDINEKYKTFDEDEMDYNRFDAGWNIAAGVEINRFTIDLSTQLGFCKIVDFNKNYLGKYFTEIDSPKNANIGISVGYRF